MDVVWHEAVGPDFDVIAIGALPEPSEILPKIGVLLENGLLVVPPLSDLMRVRDEGGTGEPSHILSRLPPMAPERAQAG
jgi:hypothetical protein